MQQRLSASGGGIAATCCARVGRSATMAKSLSAWTTTAEHAVGITSPSLPIRRSVFTRSVLSSSSSSPTRSSTFRLPSPSSASSRSASSVAEGRTTTSTATTAATAAKEDSAVLAGSGKQVGAAPPVRAEDAGKLNLIGLTKDELRAELTTGPLKLERYRAKQVWHWMYYQGARSFDEMMNIARPLRSQLAERYVLDWGRVVRERMSVDGTRKWLVDFGGQQVETVYIPEENRGTACLSSQVGCTLSCTFCHTGTQKVVRNLKASEIVGQFLNARKAMLDLPPLSDKKRIISNIVFMGQGEPFYNFRNLSKALQILLDPEGCEVSKRRITVSTSGVVPMIKRLGEEFPGIRLAVSLHAPTDALRDQIVPINRQFKIAELMDACRNFPGLSWTHKITWEYVMLKGVNDSPADARELLRLIQDIPSLVNLIPFNTWPGAPYECSPKESILAFQKILHEANIDAPIRWPRGNDIMAACGQLRTASQKAPESAPKRSSMSMEEVNKLISSFEV